MKLFQYFVAATNQYKYTCIHTVNGKALNTRSYQHLQEKVASSEACLAFPPDSQSVPTKKKLHVPVFETMKNIILLSHRAILIFQCNLSLSNELKFLNKIKSKLTVTHRFLLPVSEFKVVTVVSVKWLKYLLTKTSKRAKELAVIHFHNVTPVMHFDKIHVHSHYTKYNRPR